MCGCFSLPRLYLYKKYSGFFASVFNPQDMGVTLEWRDRASWGWVLDNKHLMHATQACKVLPVQMTGYPSANHDADGLTQGSGHFSLPFPPPCLN